MQRVEYDLKLQRYYKECRYIGSIISKDGEIKEDVEHRIRVGWFQWRLGFGLDCDQCILTRLKGKSYSTTIKPTMTYWSRMLANEEVTSE